MTIILWVVCAVIAVFVFAAEAVDRAREDYRRLEQQIADIVSDSDFQRWEAEQ